jgi:DNA-directed RNA polymerase alpha subunit
MAMSGDAAVSEPAPFLSPGLATVPERVRQIAMLRGLGYSFRKIGEQFSVSPQAVSLMLTRHLRSLQSLRGAVELGDLSARAVNALGRHGIGNRDEARQRGVLALLKDERNCGRKTLDEIARWIQQEEEVTRDRQGLVSVA